jgi:small subunit ribosomal protein S18
MMEKTTMSSSPFMMKKKKNCPLTASNIQDVDYKDLELLRQFISERGKILPRRISGVSCYHQRQLKKAILRARFMALLPFVAED